MDIFETLAVAANPEQAAGMSAYMREQFAYLGIPTPERKKLCRDFLKTQKTVDWPFIFKCWELPKREYQYLAMDCLTKLKPQLTPDDVPNIKRLITARQIPNGCGILSGNTETKCRR